MKDKLTKKQTKECSRWSHSSFLEPLSEKKKRISFKELFLNKFESK